MLLIVTLIALFVVVTYKILASEIKAEGLLSDKRSHEFSPGRLQLLLVTIGSAAYYLYQTLGASATGEFPPVPVVLLWVLVASNAGYLGGKVYSGMGRSTRG